MKMIIFYISDNSKHGLAREKNRENLKLWIARQASPNERIEKLNENQCFLRGVQCRQKVFAKKLLCYEYH